MGGGQLSHVEQLLAGVGGDGVVGPLVAALDVDHAGVDELAHVVGEQRLLDVEQRDQLALAHRLGVAAQHVEMCTRTGSDSALATVAMRSASSAGSSPTAGDAARSGGGAWGMGSGAVTSMDVVARAIRYRPDQRTSI